MRDGETVRMCLRAFMLAAMLVRMWGGPAVAHAEATPPVDPLRPNIVLIVGEDMGPDLGAYGCKDAI
ncbi:MAG: sulfatase, partial [Planctomycetota bacterium]